LISINRTGSKGVKMLFALCLLPFCLLSSQAWSEEDEPLTGTAAVSQGVDAKAIEARIAGFGDASLLDVESKVALASYQAALNHLRASERDEAETSRFKQLIDSASDKKAELEEQLQQLISSSDISVGVETVFPVAELEQRLDQAQADGKLMQGRLAELEDLRANERLRREQGADKVAQTKLDLQEVESELKRLGLTSGPDAATQARQVELQSSQLALRNRLERLDMERLSRNPRKELLKLQTDLLRAQINRQNENAQRLQALLNEKRGAEAEQASLEAEQARREALGKHELIQGAARRNAELGDQLGSLTGELERALRNRERVSGNLQSIERNMSRVRRQLDISYVDDSLGKMLRDHRKELPDIHQLERRLDETRRQLAKARLKQFQLDDRRQKLLDPISALDQPGVERPAGLNEAQWSALRPELDKLYADGLGLIAQLESTYERYEKALGDFEEELTQQMGKVEAYAELLDRNLLWTPNARPMDRAMLMDAWSLLPVLVDKSEWRSVLQWMQGSLVKKPAKVLLVLVIALLMLLFRPRMWRTLGEIEPKVGNVTRDSFFLTFRALLISFLLAMPWVLLLAALGLLLKAEPKPIGDAISGLLITSATIFSLIQVARYLFVPNGLAEVHFRWNPALNRSCRRHLGWFVIFTVPVFVIIAASQMEGDLVTREALGRVLSILWLLGAWLLMERLLNPWSGAGVRRPSKAHGIRLWRLLAYLTTMVFFLFLAVLEYSGYYYTVNSLIHLMILSVGAGLLVLLAYNMAVRWLLVAERRLALARAREKRQATQEARAAKEAAEAAGESLLELPELEEINLSAISEQTRRLLRVAATLTLAVVLFLIWSKLTPAIGRLDEMILWTHTTGKDDTQLLVPVSVWDLAMNLLVIGLMIVAGRNLPGLLEITLLQPLKIDPGMRYAISRISHYVIYGAGTVIALQVIGLGWGDIQWLVAAMGVGLGFGLQEIFANFISGLMILFERPIRIGDAVTVGDVSGIVTRIRMRATTITDWDNKELLIPNKSFVTDPLINWTLSDEITRIVIPVGIAYGSDTEKAHRIMTDVVISHPDVMTEPKPTVLFLGFGDSSLDFKVRAFVREQYKRMSLIHDLHMALDKALREAGIEIPFPQRDLHLRSVDPGIDLKS